MITLLCLMFLASPVFAGQTNATYNFIITVDGAKQDILLVGPENEDIHIGVIGRKFYPSDDAKRGKDKWPAGKWIASVAPPYDPAREWWDYELILRPDGSVAFTEIEHHQDYDKDLKPQGKETTRIRLALSGRWRMVEGKGQLAFTQTKTTEPNNERVSERRSAL